MYGKLGWGSQLATTVPFH